MKIISSLIAIVTVTFSLNATAQSSAEPWRPGQLVEPEQLFLAINSTAKEQPLVICVGPSALIKGSIETGPVHEQENLNKLKALLSGQPKNREIIIYCGCCPFEHCPNIRPAFILLNQMGFTNPKLLNLPHNLKADWIDKGYPTNN
jgi:thiosulfate/3-mercaptopyruvate sulfurtransferase